MQKDYTMRHFLLVMTVYFIYTYILFQFPRFCKTTQRLIFLQHPTQFIIHCHPNTRQYPRIISASGSQSFFYCDALEEWRPHKRNTWKMTSIWAKYLRNDLHIRETLEKWLPHARNTWKITSIWAKYLKNDVHMGATLEEWRPHTRNTWRMTSTYAKHLKNDVHMGETIEEWRPHGRNTWRMTSTWANHFKNDVHNTFSI